MLNPDIKFAKSMGIDLPIMYVYLVGKISGNCMAECVSWRKEIIEHYRKFKKVDSGYEAYPVSFICPLNSGESKTADALGLKSHLNKNLIYDKDILSLSKADIIMANLDDFMELGLEDELDISGQISRGPTDFEKGFYKLQSAIINRRANLGSHFEVSVALYLRKPVILIAGNERNKYILDNHPFFSRASVIVLTTEQLLKEKWIQTLYKSMAGSTGEY